jgi:hypothetical protein
MAFYCVLCFTVLFSISFILSVSRDYVIFHVFVSRPLLYYLVQTSVTATTVLVSKMDLSEMCCEDGRWIELA